MVQEKIPAAGEVVQSKSPAEFFAENQNIAGFDNPGKSLYTTIRELVENSLDAAEAIGVLPDVALKIEEFTEKQFNDLRGMDHREVVDEELFLDAAGRKKNKNKNKNKKEADTAASVEGGGGKGGDDDGEGGGAGAGAGAKKKGAGRKAETFYYRVTCRDNGSGMQHTKVPNMLGRVLSSSKYGVRQTRGKFGLGAKMALIWSKKSTGMPIEVRTALSLDPLVAPSFVTKCVLDIDIYKNEPRVHELSKQPNSEGWRGTEVVVCVGGKWSAYRPRILQYLQQLAVITPYCHMSLLFQKVGSGAADLELDYARRSEQMPPLAREVKHHPSSVNNLLMQQLLDRTEHDTLLDFLCYDLSCVERAVASRIIAELGKGFSDTLEPQALSTKNVNRLTQMLRDVSMFKPPDGLCLSPAGEYNLRLGIVKETGPNYVATASEKPSVCDGHPFIVEAGISLGGAEVKEGISVHRFANRIPLLFEAGADVATRVAARLAWASYKIDSKRDRIGVFVSIVSTKIPFKGTGKEYIGDDVEEIQRAVKRAMQSCCQQLKVQLLKRNAIREGKERKRMLVRYIPDVSRALFGILTAMQRQAEEREGEGGEGKGGGGAGSSAKRGKRGRGGWDEASLELLSDAQQGKLTTKLLHERLAETVDRHDATALEEEKQALGRGSMARHALALRPLSSSSLRRKGLLCLPLYGSNSAQGKPSRGGGGGAGKAKRPRQGEGLHPSPDRDGDGDGDGAAGGEGGGHERAAAGGGGKAEFSLRLLKSAMVQPCAEAELIMARHFDGVGGGGGGKVRDERGFDFATGGGAGSSDDEDGLGLGDDDDIDGDYSHSNRPGGSVDLTDAEDDVIMLE